MVSTSAWHAAGGGFDSRTRYVSLLGVNTWLSTLEIVYLELCLSEETLKAVGPFYLVSMPGEVKYPTQGVNRQIPVVDSTPLSTTPVLAQRWAVWSIGAYITKNYGLRVRVGSIKLAILSCELLSYADPI